MALSRMVGSLEVDQSGPSSRCQETHLEKAPLGLLNCAPPGLHVQGFYLFTLFSPWAGLSPNAQRHSGTLRPPLSSTQIHAVLASMLPASALSCGLLASPSPSSPRSLAKDWLPGAQGSARGLRARLGRRYCIC